MSCCKWCPGYNAGAKWKSSANMLCLNFYFIHNLIVIFILNLVFVFLHFYFCLFSICLLFSLYQFIKYIFICNSYLFLFLSYHVFHFHSFSRSLIHWFSFLFLLFKLYANLNLNLNLFWGYIYSLEINYYHCNDFLLMSFLQIAVAK